MYHFGISFDSRYKPIKFHVQWKKKNVDNEYFTEFMLQSADIRKWQNCLNLIKVHIWWARRVSAIQFSG